MKYLNLVFIALFFGAVACNNEKSGENKYATRTAEEGGYSYEYVTSDPMETRIYTLDNGLKVYLSVYKDAPRAHVFVPVKAGGKNDPAENTGLAHYLEHMMFKGSDKFGTLDYKKEKPLLDSIEHMFNTYASLTDDAERKDYYRLIDHASNEAAKLAVPNEYDKLISAIGGKGLNAYTTEDRTVYTVDIPSNEVEKFLEIEGSRFRTIVNRLFHTELEAVYEEKNRSLDSDGWKSYEAMYKLAFQEHPYGTQTVIGTIDHLKNPSITEIKKYFKKYYRPNNVAICISGDIDPTKTIQTIEKYFGSWEPNKDLQPIPKIEEKPITAPRATEVWGPDAERVNLGFRFGGTSSNDYAMVTMIDMLLNNSEAGLIDLNLKQKQKVLNAGCYVDNMNDYSMHSFYGEPKEGQTLEEVQQLILDQIELIKTGDFEDWLIDAVVTDLKKYKMQQMESNWSRANEMVMAFTNNMEWADYISFLYRLDTITKPQIMEFAKTNYSNNYVVVYKRNGEDPNKQHVDKPQITKVPLNRDTTSAFYKTITQKESPRLEPVFVDYTRDIAKKETASGIDILAKENHENELFELTYLLDIGSNNDPAMKIAVEYLEYIGTEALTAEELKKEFYKLGCSMSVYASEDRTYVTLRGLDENMEASLALFEGLLKNPKPDQEALDNFIDRELKSREDAKKNKSRILWSGLMNYGQYGAKSPFTNVLSNAGLESLKAPELTEKITALTDMEHRVLYYGPRSVEKVAGLIEEKHITPEKLIPLPEAVEFKQVATEKPKIYWTDYDMVQSEFMLLANGNQYDKNIVPDIRLYNEYFGSLVFQEIREAQGLAYAVFSAYNTPSKANKDNTLMAYVGTQADKQSESMSAIHDLLENMPESEENFEVAKKAILSKIASERVTKEQVLWNFEEAKRLDLDYDIRRDVYNKVRNMTFEDLKDFQKEYVKNQTYTTVLIGSRDKINFEELKKYGVVEELSLEDLFGYEKVERVDLEMN